MSLNLLARQFGKRSRIYSVDASPVVVREMKRAMREHRYSRDVVIKRANAQRLPFKTNHFDLAVSLFALHHFSNPKRALCEMGRVTCHQGKLIVADWRPEAGKPLMLHAASDIPSPNFVNTQFKRLGYRTTNRIRRYWYLIEATK
jgi:ubiquinone/menaquinone biosynthesis C-methylase UbiE